MMAITRQSNNKVTGSDSSGRDISASPGAMTKVLLDNFIEAWKWLMADCGHGFSPLTLAVKEGYEDAVRELVELGADVNHADRSGHTPLERAIEDNNVDMIRALVEVGVEVNTTKVLEIHPSSVSEAARMGSIPALRTLVELGGDVDGFDKNGHTPLCCAAYKGQTDIIEALVELGANINTPDEASGATPVYIAAREGQTGAIITLSELGADLSVAVKDDGSTALHIAAYKKQLGDIRALAEHGADINTPMNDGRTSLFIAAWNGKVDIIKALVDHGANVNTPENGGCTPLYIAAQEGNVGAIRLLADHGDSINTPNKHGHTPLYVAAYKGHMVTIKALINMKADIYEGSNMNKFPLCAALTNMSLDNRRQVSLLLVNNGADIRKCFTSLPPAQTEHIREMMTQLFDSVSLSSNPDYDGAATSAAKCSLFSLTKLMSRACRDDCSCDKSDSESDGDSDDDIHVQEENSEEQNVFESTIANSLQQHISIAVLVRMQDTRYVLKRRLVRVAWRVYQSSLLLDGDRITLPVKVRRYMELVCFLLDPAMLVDVLALRMTCKSNCERRRFPLCCGAYQELEANIIEECVAYGSCRFVSTDILHAVMAIHSQYDTDAVHS